MTTFKTYHGTHDGPFLGVAPTRRKVSFETVDVMRVQDGKITKDEALTKAGNPQALEMNFKGIFLSQGSRILGG